MIEFDQRKGSAEQTFSFNIYFCIKMVNTKINNINKITKPKQEVDIINKVDCRRLLNEVTKCR